MLDGSATVPFGSFGALRRALDDTRVKPEVEEGLLRAGCGAGQGRRGGGGAGGAELISVTTR